MMFRSNVAALICYKEKYLICCRKDYGSWQTVQGGIEKFDTTAENALIRELHEELGMDTNHFIILFRSAVWRRYHIPKKIVKDKKLPYDGQDQLWFFIELLDDQFITQSHQNEFVITEWVSINEFLNRYSIWKKTVVYDFCRELGLL